MPMICKSGNTNMHSFFKTKFQIDTLDEIGQDQQNCLHYALSKGKTDMVKYAVENASDRSKLLNQ